MPKADVLQLISDFSFAQADSVNAERYYRDVVFDLGRQPVVTQATLVAVVAGTAIYELPDGAVHRLGVFYDDEWLTEARLHELEWIDAAWRNRRGHPVAFVAEDESSTTIRLYPVPDAASKPFDFSAYGSPLGRDYPEDALVFFHTERRDDLPAWCDLYLTLAVLAREFARESAHRDDEFAAACKQAAEWLGRIVL